MTTPLASRLAERAAATGLEDIPEAAQVQARRGILDVIGVMAAGGRSEAGQGYLAFHRRWAAIGPASVIDESATWSPIDAARINGTLAHALDYDDRGHASTHLFAAVLAVGELGAADGAAILRAYVLAREVRAALDRVVDEGRMEGGGPGSRGWHSTGVNGPIASALGAGLVLGLSADGLAMAMAMAASASAGLIANFGTATKPLHAGRAAAEGVTAALQVETGIDADPAAIDGPAGLFEALGLDPAAAASEVLSRVESTWDLVERGVRIKPYPSCTTTHAGIETARRIHDRHGPIPVDRIAAIRMDVRAFMLRRLDPAGPTEARFNMAFGVFRALERGAVEAGDYVPGTVAALRERGAFARVVHVPGSGELEVELDDGTTVREPLAPMRNLTTDDEIVSKFRSNTSAWPVRRQDAVIELTDRLAATGVAELGRALRAADG